MLFGPAIGTVLFGLYLLFAGQASGTEIGAGLVAASAAAVFAVLLHQTAERRFRFKAPWPRVFLAPLASLVSDSFRVGAVLVQAVRRRPPGPVGVVAHQPFRAGGDDPADAARRGFVTLGSSLAPNGFVLSVEDEAEALVLHRLAAAPPSSDQEWPI